MDFNTEAITWDNERRIKRAKIIAEQISDAVDLKNNDSVLEFGCGTSLLGFNLCNKVKNITCIDTCPGMIDVLNLKIEQENVKNMRACMQDINDEQMVAEEYDLIYTSMALHHIIDVKSTLINLYKLLKKDGSLCIIDLDEDDGSFHKEYKDFDGHNGFNQNELKKIMVEVGYKELESHTFYKDEKKFDEVMVEYSLFVMVGRK